jgi:predicted DNA-binding transcriptional regulator AlpA
MKLSPADKFALANFDSLPAAAFVRLPVVVALTGTSAATAWRWARAEFLPRPVKLGAGTTAWRVGDLRIALAKLAAEAV